MRRLLVISATSILLAGLLATPALAAPANDNFASATLLAGTKIARTSDTNVAATPEGSEPAHAGSAANASIWYRWTPTLSGPTRITTQGSSFDTRLAVYTGATVSGLAEVVSNDDDPDGEVLTSRVRFDAVGGTTYRIVVDGYVGETGTVKLNLFEGPPSTTRVNLVNGGTGEALNGGSRTPSLDLDGSHVAFMAGADNLIGAGVDTNFSQDIFVRDRALNTTTRASVTVTGTQANNDSYEPVSNTDGNIVSFTSDATNLLGAGVDSNGFQDIFVRNISGLTTTRASVSDTEAQSDDDSDFSDLTPDGNQVVFESWATNLILPTLDNNGNADVFLRSISGGTTSRISVTDAEAQANGNSFNPAVNADGTKIAFESRADNLQAVGPDGNGNVRDIFLRNTTTGNTTRVSVGTGSLEGNAASLNASISSDGTKIAFESDASNFLANDTNGARDIFVHDTLTGVTTRVSVRTGGIQGKGDSFNAQISDDGRWVVFESDANNLVLGDTNGTTDVFLHDRTTGITTRASVGVGGDEANTGGDIPAISGDHQLVAFESQSNNLVSTDNNDMIDVFARPVLYQVDALIKKAADAGYNGDGVYQTPATTQKLPQIKVKRGSINTFNLRVQNDGSVSDSYEVAGCKKSRGFKVQYKVGATDVTAAVIGTGYQTGQLAADDAVDITLIIAVSTSVKAAKTGAVKLCQVTATSNTDATKIDQVASDMKVRK